ncbi:Uncharacterised protein [Serratia ficaria]|uniref:hypothetical protein n=1 Tax=Serratia ficaria TaxID=61651 RepID=UPI002182F486|nr:hypothetical protein [Serratia ficaria]CAI2496486.1 Uncharacterised protein [Serratia ficaria]
MRQSAETDALLESMPRRTSKTKMIYGIGVNDSEFCTSARIDGTCVNHRAYAAWNGMFKRCYCTSYKKEMKTYDGCSVDVRWHKFSDFFRWWKLNHVKGWHLDKDIISVGNKIYSPDFCAFIPPSINSFVSLSINRDDNWPIGAFKCSDGGKYFSKIRDRDGRQRHLGTFASPEEAHTAWKKAKLEQAESYRNVCDKIHPSLFSGLVNKINSMR